MSQPAVLASQQTQEKVWLALTASTAGEPRERPCGAASKDRRGRTIRTLVEQVQASLATMQRAEDVQQKLQSTTLE